MKKITYLLFGICSYLSVLFTLLYAIGFVGDFMVPETMDSGPKKPLFVALLINTSLLLFYVWQHNIMTGPVFKNRRYLVVPATLRRSCFVLASSLCLLMIMWLWQPIEGMVWSVENKVAIDLLRILYLVGWGIVFISTFLVNHFELFGLRQVWLFFTNKPYTEVNYGVPGICRLMRHPLYAGFLIASWSTPVMTSTHLLFAMLASGYIVLVTRFEAKHKWYKNRLPVLITFYRKKEAK